MTVSVRFLPETPRRRRTYLGPDCAYEIDGGAMRRIDGSQAEKVGHGVAWPFKNAS